MTARSYYWELFVISLPTQFICKGGVHRHGRLISWKLGWSNPPFLYVFILHRVYELIAVNAMDEYEVVAELFTLYECIL